MLKGKQQYCGNWVQRSVTKATVVTNFICFICYFENSQDNTLTVRLVKLNKEKGTPDGQHLLATNVRFNQMANESQLNLMQSYGEYKGDLTFSIYSKPTLLRAIKFIEAKTPSNHVLPDILGFKDSDNSITKLSLDQDTSALISGWNIVFHAHYVTFLRTGQADKLDKKLYYFFFAKVTTPEDAKPVSLLFNL